eukprot:TRINITY_DN6993_c0_g1_i1.p1 TRINITY_DN6993_c0_g1~~TRINITY_DN6993_c0_g1_i1.p1  ORF type:complete len:319 (+),score=52.83 TRINITY_DN6993_c0_g1_i1:86-1042(+)
MIRRPPRSTLSSSSAASDVYKRQVVSTQSTGDPLPQQMAASSPAERTVGVDGLAHDLNQHILNTRGMWLAGSVRLQVCHAAREAVGCTSCLEGTSLTDSSAHDCASFEDPATGSILAPIIHAIVRNQSILTESWYKHALSTLSELHTEPAHGVEDNHVVFNEVLLLTAMSFAMTTFYRGIGKPCPPLPDECLSPPPSPLGLKVTDISSRTRSDPTWNFSPYFLPEDVNPALEAKISPGAWSLLVGDGNKNEVSPLNAATWAIEDVAFFVSTFSPGVYLPMEEVISPWAPLRPMHCAGVSRAQIELAAESLAAAYDCTF